MQRGTEFCSPNEDLGFVVQAEGDCMRGSPAEGDCGCCSPVFDTFSPE